RRWPLGAGAGPRLDTVPEPARHHDAGDGRTRIPPRAVAVGRPGCYPRSPGVRRRWPDAQRRQHARGRRHSEAVQLRQAPRHRGAARDLAHPEHAEEGAVTDETTRPADPDDEIDDIDDEAEPF